MAAPHSNDGEWRSWQSGKWIRLRGCAPPALHTTMDSSSRKFRVTERSVTLVRSVAARCGTIAASLMSERAFLRAVAIQCDCNSTSLSLEEAILIPVIPEDTLERKFYMDFRLWHILLMGFASVMAVVICVCCCVRFRIPRTKQEIEADYMRKKITRKFKKQLQCIQNTEMDEMDLKRETVAVHPEHGDGRDGFETRLVLEGGSLMCLALASQHSPTACHNLHSQPKGNPTTSSASLIGATDSVHLRLLLRALVTQHFIYVTVKQPSLSRLL
ncbi:hypothetical protein J6590_058934 [Homalodisca vitripennis]|nr:hypothetical protein J6590_058934 [Homalodisca vitripennis]